MTGESTAIAALRDSIVKAARGKWTVLIQGESGTGKGLVARAIHEGSRRTGPFVVVNCGAIPENLIESELFGHERGAFTGAYRLKKGKFEAAHGGTIFLDEIGELPLAGQTRLLHVLQDKEIERLGGEGRRIPVDVRVIAATNRDLHQMVSERAFRQDLFFRLNVFSIHTPPLRERLDDIPALAHHFTLNAALHADRALLGVSPEVIRLLKNHYWPGNVRELENVVTRAVAVGETEHVRMQDLPDEFFARKLPKPKPRPGRFQEIMEATSREVCLEAVTASNGDCRLAARTLGLHRNSLYRLLRRHRLTHLMETSKTPCPPA